MADKTKGKITNVELVGNHAVRITIREEDKDGKVLKDYQLTVPPDWNKYQILEKLKKESEPVRKKRKKMDELVADITTQELEDALNG